ncbi:MAG: DUF1624 domain-containing protein [Bacteroidetes bacterium]|nr:DUF1624 domain-containing protein [Bacteroidota bacterium]MCW5895680.1 DUF1624 domain-containing protein [Bacteroidota bacterium]
MLARLRQFLSAEIRNQTADLLKGLAVVFMILVHLVELFSTPAIYESIAGRVALFLGGPPAAPVFMAVMGYFLASSRKSFFQQIRRGVFLFLGGVLLNIGLNLNLLFSIRSGRFDLDPLAYIFGADVLPLAGLSVMAIALLRTIFRQSWIAYLILAFAAAALTPLLHNIESSDPFLKYIVPFFWGKSSWSYFPLFPWLAYPLLGYAYKIGSESFTLHSQMTPLIRLLLLAFCACCLLMFSKNALAISVDLSRYYHHSLSFTLWVALFLCAWSLLVSFFEEHTGNTLPVLYIKWIGRNVTAAYVFQWLFIGNLATELYRTQTVIQTLIWFFVVLAATSCCIPIWQRLKPKLATLLASSVSFQ